MMLAISEPAAGSDVANIQTKAFRGNESKFYIVNGEKYWISNGFCFKQKISIL